jgi:Bacterial Ig-like domain (group 3)
MSRCRLALALSLVVFGLALGATAGSAAAATTAPGHTIATAGTLATSGTASGGGAAIDFWKVKLNGGDRLQLLVDASVAYYFNFQLYAPGTNDANFPSAKAFATGSTNDSAKAVIELQAPYNGTFVLAVCEGLTVGLCPAVDSGEGNDPMDAYTFTTSLAASVPAAVAAKEQRAGATIGGAPTMGLGHFEAGGGNPIDFWKIKLNAGDKVQFSINTSVAYYFNFQLFPPGTNDANFPSADSVASGTTNDSTKAVIDLKAPHSGTYVLGVCEGLTVGLCPAVDSGEGNNPMDPYTFTPKLAGGLETRTSVRLSASSVKYGHEKGFRFTVAVAAIYGGRPVGKVVISDGKKALCVAKVVNGKGYCALSSNTKIPVGKYAITGAYTGNHDASTSGKATLTVKRS